MKQIYDNKDIGETIDKSFDAGIKEGYRRCKEEMMKKAVEADVNTYRNLEEGTSWAEFVVEMSTNNLGDKVKIIIVKEDGE